MSPQTLGYLGILAVLVVMAAGIHVGVALGLVGFFGIWAITGNIQAGIGLIEVAGYIRVVTYSLTVLPLFIAMSHFALEAGMSTDIFNAASKWVGRLPGGLAIATVLGNGVFGAICGSSIVATTVFTKIAYPEMMKFNYDKSFSCGTIVGGAMLGMLIPPSVLMVIYGVITEQSIAQLLMAGIGPGILLMTLFSILCFFVAFFKPRLLPKSPNTYSLREKLASMKGLWAVVAVILLLVGGLYTGIFSATEAGAVGAFGVFVIALAQRRLPGLKIWRALRESAHVNATIFLVLMGATMFSKFVSLSGIAKGATQAIIAAGIPPLIMIGGFILLYLVMGLFLDSMSMMLLTLPILHPLIISLGMNPIWFAMLVIMSIEIGLLTPPVGLNVYAMKAALGEGIDLATIFKGALPFFAVSLVALVVMIFIPPISTYIPSTMFRR